jgi:urease accessory protein
VDGHLEFARCEPPLTVKATNRPDGLELLLVGSAASLLEGDDLTIDIRVTGTVPIIVKSVAAQVAHPCPNGGSTRQNIRVSIKGGARLFWSVEPLIIAAGANHQNNFLVELDSASTCVIHDTILLGRSAEDPQLAKLCAQMFVMHDGAVLFEDGFDTSTPGAHGPSGLNGMRFVSTAIAAGWRPFTDASQMCLAGEGSLVRTMGIDATSCGTVVSDAASSWWTHS